MLRKEFPDAPAYSPPAVFHGLLAMEGISFEGGPSAVNCWAADADELLSFAEGGAGGIVANGSGSGRTHAFSRHVEACPGVELGIPNGAEAWLAQKYGAQWATPVVRGSRVGVRDLGCSILYDGAIPFADDGLLYFVVNGSCVVAMLVNVAAAWRAVLLAAPYP